MGNLVVVGLGQLRPLFSAYEQFVGRLCNVFKIPNGRRSLWNGTQINEHYSLKNRCTNDL